MQIEMRKNPYQKYWWDATVIRLVMYISRNDMVWIGVGVVLLVLYFKFPITWDSVFGLHSR